jgi:hypothetical protein
MFNRRSPEPIFNLKASGVIFPVKKAHLLNQLGLFQEDPSLLNAECYEVRTKVPPPVFASFLKIVEGDDIIPSEEIYRPFRLLSEEFRFEALSAKCAAFAALNESFWKDSTEGGKDSLAMRVCDLEKRFRH